MFVLVVRNSFNAEAVEASYMLSAYLQSQHIGYMHVDSVDLAPGGAASDRDAFWREVALEHGVNPVDPDVAQSMLVVVLGGDGTILRSAKLVSGFDVAILGVNFGHLGFLANSSEDGVLSLLTRALAGEMVVERRCNLDIVVECESESEGSEPSASEEGFSAEGMGLSEDGCGHFFALNELALTRGGLGLTIDYALEVSGVHMADVSGDGAIVATSTGSTAYSLAAGGPLVSPAYDGMIVQPLAPHTLTARAILTDPSDVVCIDLSRTRDGRQATLFADGDPLALESPAKRVYIKRGEVPTTLLYAEDRHFYKYAAQTFFETSL